ncbi:hypothetical protein EMPS_10276 [Entomortierella parvispora]|uniref:Uncharacterized protein n=1 Tax=Entomortierella parvispora TaxID=205924 RepID=A0A9P3M157_9FUNG|nr:hypothetical protein EMPS_10276 [Entomortierella parvispora]
MDDQRPRILDKRQAPSGIEYLVSVTDEWVPSSTSRFIQPELVELYEWLNSSGFREGDDALPTVIRPKIAVPKGTRIRTTSSNGGYPSQLLRAQQKEQQQRIQENKEPRKHSAPEDHHLEADSEQSRQAKKQRLEGSYIEGLGHLKISNDTPGQDDSDREKESASESTTTSPPPSVSTSNQPSEVKTSAANSTPKTPSSPAPPQLMEFNRNTEQMVEVYFKEGMDASGVEMFDVVLGPYRRPTKEFVAAFFFAVVLSPLTDPATIEAAIHVLDRALTLHGPQIFEDVWSVQKRRREFAEGNSPFSRQQSSSSSAATGASLLGESTSFQQREGPLGMDRAIANRLPNWNDLWDVVKAELGLDSKPESKQHIALQEHHIRLRLQGEDQTQEPSSPIMEDLFKSEAQTVREELGRAIVGLLLRVLEQDSVSTNVGTRSFFCRNVLRYDPFSPSHGVRQTLDVVFQVAGLATSSKFFSPPAPKIMAPVGKSGPRATGPWPLEDRCQLNAAGMETLQLGQQILLLLVRFTQAGTLFPEKGLEELAREALSRLSKMNKDRKVATTSSGRSSTGSPSPSLPFILERYNLDQTEIFLKTLLQGPCLLGSGTGSGAGLKCAMKENKFESPVKNESFASSAIGIGTGSGLPEGAFKSQTGLCMGSSTFVMVLVDLWFQSKTTSKGSGGGGSSMLKFKTVVETYAMPPHVRPVANTASSKKGSKSSPSLDDDERVSENWNAKDMEQLEWTVMMIEVLVWAWIEARGIRRHEIEGTGLEQALFPTDQSSQKTNSSGGSSQGHSSSGWLVMSDLLSAVGGSLQRRWEHIENAIEAAIMIEDLCLR